MDEKRQVQKELFEEFGSTEKRRYPKNVFQQKPKRTITLLYEHLAFIAIGIIIFSLIAFSFGVERGKAIGMRRASLVIKEKEEKEEKKPQDGSQGRNVRLSRLSRTNVRGTNVRGESAVSSANGGIKEEKESVPPQKYEKEPIPGYTVQVASYTSEGFAKRRVDKLRSEGYEAFTLQKGSYYIMCIGKFRDKKSAALEMKKLRKIYSDCLVRKIN